jgi:hypothetical protein
MEPKADPVATPAHEPGAAAPILRRRVYYVCGVDPRGADFYHQMWRAEAGRQGPVDGREYTVGDASADGPHATRWRVRARSEGIETESEHVFLHWEDLMRAWWPQSRLETLRRLPGLYWMYLTSGMLARTWSCARGFFWAYFLMPVIYALLAALLAAGTGWAAARGAAALGWPAAPSALLVAAVVLGTLWLALLNAENIRLFWLCRAQVFMGLWATQPPEAFAQRWQAFAQRIEDDRQRDVPGEAPQEVLLVAHCGGAPAAVHVAQAWLALQPPGTPASGLKLLTLGQAIPLLGLSPKAQWFREHLRVVGASGLPWLDYTAPSDPLCYALANPFTTCGVPLPADAPYRLKSSRFDRMFPAREYARLRKDIFRIHFQYLMASRQPVDNDWFQLTCGPRPLPMQ